MMLVWLFIFAALAALTWILTRRRPAPGVPVYPTPPYPYEQAGPLFSAAELSFLGVLEQSVGAELRVLGKVRLADLIRPAGGLASGPKSAAFNRISRKHVDFVLCDPNSLAVVAVVELDDRSHQRADRRERDALVDGALAAAGITVLHVPCRQAYCVTELRERVLREIHPVRSGASNGRSLRAAS